jgi:hypothetical protein
MKTFFLLIVAPCIVTQLAYADGGDESRSKRSKRFAEAIETINRGALKDGFLDSVDGLNAFTTDGCSAINKANKILNDNLKGCCLAHDFSYWLGGTSLDRMVADLNLGDCAETATGKKWIGDLMYYTVKKCGGPGTGRSYQWGYGWQINPPYTKKEDLKNKTPALIQFINEEIDRFESVMSESLSL